MGQKVSPIGLRIGINKTWESNWYANNKDFAKYLNNDIKIRKYLEKRLKGASVASVLIERTAKKTDVIISTAKPGVVIGHGGEEIEKIKKELTKLVGENIQISIIEIKSYSIANSNIKYSNEQIQEKLRYLKQFYDKDLITTSDYIDAKRILINQFIGQPVPIISRELNKNNSNITTCQQEQEMYDPTID